MLRRTRVSGVDTHRAPVRSAYRPLVRLADPETVRAEIAAGKITDQSGGKWSRKRARRLKRIARRWEDRS